MCLDPARTLRQIVGNAGEEGAIVVQEVKEGLMLTTEAMVAEKPKEEKAPAGGGHAHGGGDF